MVMSKAGNRIIDSVRRARREYGVLHVPLDVDVRAIRDGLGMTQEAFALRFGFTVASVRDWEQGRRRPEQAARVLLLVIKHDHRVVDKALAIGLGVQA